MQENNTISPSILASSNKQDVQSSSFDSFLNEFKTTIKRLFREENDINQLSVKRGITPNMLGQIMDCNPLSLSIPVEFGGRGGTVAENMQMLSAASYESMALSLTLGINSALFMQPVAKYGQQEAKKEVFERFLNAQNMGGLMITEPGYGSDALNMQTSFVEEKNHYHLRGTKHWAGLTASQVACAGAVRPCTRCWPMACPAWWGRWQGALWAMLPAWRRCTGQPWWPVCCPACVPGRWGTAPSRNGAWNDREKR